MEMQKINNGNGKTGNGYGNINRFHVKFLHLFSYRTDKPIGLVGFNVKVYTCQAVTLDK